MDIISLQNFIKSNCFTYRGLNNRVTFISWWQNKSFMYIYDEILEATKFLDSTNPFSERIYCIMNNLTSIPICEVCQEKNQKFGSYKDGYTKTCSFKCAMKHPDRTTKIIANTDRKALLETLKKTNLQKYGVEWTTQLPDMITKTKKTKLERYGAEKYNNTNKANQTNMERYGVPWTSQANTVIQKINEACKQRDPRLWDAQWLSEKNKTMTLADISIEMGYSYKTIWNAFERCNVTPIFYAPKYGKMELEVVEFIKSLGIEDVVPNDWNIIKPKELDVYTPNYNLGIEINGVFWHRHIDNVPHKEKDRHEKKRILCEEKGINLIQFWDDQWINQKEICKDIIRRKLGKTSNVLYARNCNVRELNNKDYIQFTEKYHIQGGVGASIKIGLFYNEELVSIISFGKPRFTNHTYELLRYCCKHDYYIIGGIEKMFSFFKENYIYESIISYCDKLHFEGKIYKKLGFQHSYDTPLDYWWVKQNIRYSRYECQKHKLEKLLGSSNFDSNLSESGNMKNNGYYKLYGCGHSVWILE